MVGWLIYMARLGVAEWSHRVLWATIWSRHSAERYRLRALVFLEGLGQEAVHRRQVRRSEKAFLWQESAGILLLLMSILIAYSHSPVMASISNAEFENRILSTKDIITIGVLVLHPTLTRNDLSRDGFPVGVDLRVRKGLRMGFIREGGWGKSHKYIYNPACCVEYA